MNIKNKENKIIAVSFIIMLLGFFIPVPETLTRDGVITISIFIGILILWLKISIEWPSLLLIFLLGIIESIGFKSVISSSFGSETFLFLMATFLCTYPLSQTNIIKRCAYFFINTKTAKNSIWGFCKMFLISVLILGLFISPTVLFMIFLPILKQVYKSLDIEKGSKIGEILMVGLALTVSISSGMTPIAHVFSNLAMDFYNKYTQNNITYIQYSMLAVPIGILVFIIMIYTFKIIYKKDIEEIKNKSIANNIETLGQMEKVEKIVAAIFLITVALWIFPSIISNILPEISKKITSYTTAMPPLLATVALLIIKVDNKPCLDLKEALSKGVPWPSLIMASSALALAGVINNTKIGLSEFFNHNLTNILKGMSPLLIVIIIVIWVTTQTNLSSNIVTVTVVSNIAIPLIMDDANVINLKIVSILIGMLSSFAFMTPPSMPHIALAGTSGYVSASKIFKIGGICAISSAIISVVLYQLTSTLIFI